MQCPKKLVKYKEYSCFDHSDFSAHSVFTFDMCCSSLGTVSLGTQVQPKIILDPVYLPDYFFVSDDYEITMITRQNGPIFLMCSSSSIHCYVSFLHFKTFKTQFYGVPFLHYVLVCKIQIYM